MSRGSSGHPLGNVERWQHDGGAGSRVRAAGRERASPAECGAAAAGEDRRKGTGEGWKGDTYVGRGVTVTQKGLPEGRGCRGDRWVSMAVGLALRIGTCREVGLVGERCSFRASDSYPGVSPFVIALGTTTPFVTTVLEPWEGRVHPRSRALRRPRAVV